MRSASLPAVACVLAHTDLPDYAAVLREAARGPDTPPRPARSANDLDPDRARDIVWTLISPEVYEQLVNDRGWSPDEYEQWLARALADAIAAP